MSNLITKYKHEDLYLTTNTNVKLKKKKSSNDVSLAASAILFRKLCRLFHSIFGRDGRGSKSGRRPIEHTGIVIPIPAALPLAQTNRLMHTPRAHLIRRLVCTFQCSTESSTPELCSVRTPFDQSSGQVWVTRMKMKTWLCYQCSECCKYFSS